MMVNTLIQLQISVVFYLIIGFILRKIKIIDDNGAKFLSKFVLDFLLVINAFYSCINSFSIDTLQSCLIVLLIASIVEIVIYLLTKFTLPGFSQDEMHVARYGFLVSNSGLIGTPIVEGLYGSLGVMYANVFLIPTRVLAYVAGEGIFNPIKKKDIKGTIIGICTNRMIVSMFLGFVIAIIKVPVPVIINDSLGAIAHCLTPISLILVGSLLAEKMDFSFKRMWQLSLLCLIRLLIIPISTLLFLSFLPLSFDTICIIVLLLGMPMGSTCAIFALKYHGDTQFASLSVASSTILCLFSLIALLQLCYFII